MSATINAKIREITQDYLDSIDKEDLPLPTEIEAELLERCNKAIALHNMGPEDPPGSQEYPTPLKGSDKYPKLKRLQPVQLAMILSSLHNACRIGRKGISAEKDYDIIAMYQTAGHDEGTYVTCDDDFRSLVRQYDFTLTSKDFDEVMVAVRDVAPRRMVCQDQDLVAVNNGIYNYESKTLSPFDPEKVFLTKSHVNFVNNAKNPVITMPDGVKWDVESWMKDLSDDPEIVTLLWQILGAIIRPNVSWNKSAWLYSEDGNNGKGTLCALMRNLCGDGAYASIPLSDFNKDFMLAPLTHSSAIIVDENSVGTYIDQAANLKAVITGDAISINRKYKDPITYQFHGFMVQCLNEFPKVKDRSDSFYRRQIFIPMMKRFEGHERTYIKSDYLARQDVLEYVLYKILATTDYYRLSEPESCKNVLEDYMEFNDPVKQFFMDLEENAVWDLLPYSFVYDLYVQWTHRNNSSGKPLGKSQFIKELRRLADRSNVFYIAANDPIVRSAGRMDKPEPLILEYNVQTWMNQTYTGNDPDKRCRPALKSAYRGLQRRPNASRGVQTIVMPDDINDQFDKRQPSKPESQPAEKPTPAANDSTANDSATDASTPSIFATVNTVEEMKEKIKADNVPKDAPPDRSTTIPKSN